MASDMSIWIRFFEENRRAHGLSDLGKRVLAEFDSANPQHLGQVVQSYRPDAEIIDYEPFGFSVPNKDTGTKTAYYLHRKPRSPFFTGIMRDFATDEKTRLFESNDIYLAVWLCLSHSMFEADEREGWRWDTKALLDDESVEMTEESITIRLINDNSDPRPRA